MNYTDPSYPAYPPQYYKDPKNALWFVLGGAFMIFCAVMWDVVYVMLYGSVLHRLLSQAYMADGIRLIEQLVLVAFGICCIVFHENRRVLAYFCMVLSCFNLFLVTWCLVSGGYTVSAYGLWSHCAHLGVYGSVDFAERAPSGTQSRSFGAGTVGGFIFLGYIYYRRQRYRL